MNIDLDELYGDEEIKFKEGEIEEYLKTLGFIINDDSVKEIIKQTEEDETPKMELFSYKVVDPINTEGDNIWIKYIS